MRSMMVVVVCGVSLLAGAGCKKKGKKALGDKSAACTNIYNSYQSRQDMKVWMDACMAAPDENVRCVNLIMDEGKDGDCKKLVNSAERTTLVKVLNGKPDAEPTPTPTPTPAGGAPVIVASCDHGSSVCTDYISQEKATELCRPGMDGEKSDKPCPTEAVVGSCTLPEGGSIRRYYSNGESPNDAAGAEAHCKNAMGGTFAP